MGNDDSESNPIDVSQIAGNLFESANANLFNNLMAEYRQAQEFLRINESLANNQPDWDLSENITKAKATMNRISSQIAKSPGLTDALVRFLNPGKGK